MFVNFVIGAVIISAIDIVSVPCQTTRIIIWTAEAGGNRRGKARVLVDFMGTFISTTDITSVPSQAIRFSRRTAEAGDDSGRESRVLVNFVSATIITK